MEKERKIRKNKIYLKIRITEEEKRRVIAKRVPSMDGTARRG